MSKHRNFRVGLTGGIASGKSTVAARFASHGIPVIDADEVARALVAPATPGLARIAERFGAGVLAEDGTLCRPALRELIFSDAAARRDVEAILHPLIREEMDRRAAALGAVATYLVMAIPLLVETDTRGRVDRILVVDVDEARQIERLRARDGSSEPQARAILAAQTDRSSRLRVADDVLVNTGSIETLHRDVDQLHLRYLELSRV